MKFRIRIVSKDKGKIKISKSLRNKQNKKDFSTLDEVFECLAQKEHQTETATLHTATLNPTLNTVRDKANYEVVYESFKENYGRDCNVQVEEGVACYYVYQTEGPHLPFSKFKADHAEWAANRHPAPLVVAENNSDHTPVLVISPQSTPTYGPGVPVPIPNYDPPVLNRRRNKPGFLNYLSKVFNLRNLYKAFHPGNTLFISVVLTAIGIGLIGFGVACPPALVFAALGVAAFSAISAVFYAAHWLKHDWNAYLNRRRDEGSVSDYIRMRWVELWASYNQLQTLFKIAGTVLFIGALVFTSCALAGVPLFAFMTAGAFGGAIGLVGSFFSAGFSSVSVSASVAALLTSIFTGAALIVGPTNILDTIRRFVSDSRKNRNESQLEENSNELIDYTSDGVSISPEIGSNVFTTAWKKFFSDQDNKNINISTQDAGFKTRLIETPLDSNPSVDKKDSNCITQ